MRRLLLLPAAWAGLRGDRAVLRGRAGSAAATGVATSVIPCETRGCHEDNVAYKDALAHHGWQNATPPAAPEALSTGVATEHAAIAGERLFAGSPCTDATARDDLARATKMELLTNNSRLEDEARLLAQQLEQARARLGVLQAAQVRATTDNNSTARWCASRQAQMQAQEAWFEAHMQSLRNRCERAEAMSSAEFKAQFGAVLDKFRDEVASQLEMQKKKLEEEAAAAAAAQAAAEAANKKKMYGPGPLMTNYDGKCLDYNYNDGNVYMHDCHGEPNQIFHINPDTKALQTNHDNKCMDYNYNNGNVYMHDCHGDANQRWFLIDAVRFGVYAPYLSTEYDKKCLDYNYKDGNVYMHDCHAQKNQQWHFR